MFSNLRFWLEIIALPFFIFLVIHLSGHGAMLLLNPNHSHDDHEMHGEENHGTGNSGEEDSHDEVRSDTEDEHHDDHDKHETGYDDEIHDEDEHDSHEASYISEELLFGVLFMLVFIWIWHRPALKKWIPCQHDNCTEKQGWFHIAAIAAFCLHFFPEAQIRNQLLADFSLTDLTSFASAVGFLSHFLIDIIVAITLSFAFSNITYRWVSFGIIVALWLLSLYTEPHLLESIPSIGQGAGLLLSGFILAIFIHMPHRPKKKTECIHDTHIHS